MSDFLLSLKDVSLAFGGPQVLDKVSLSIHKGLRAALTGRNGEGKSTLMKVIAGQIEPDTGEIVRAPGLKVVYVGQGVEDIRRETLDARGRETEDERQVSGLTSEVLSPSPHVSRLPSQVLAGPSSSVSRPSLARSGGQIRREALEKAILSQPDLLLLDEPTNHLDVENIDWLEGMIRRQREMAVVIVTHDRRFLKRVATKILDLDRGELAGWECDYPTFVRRKQELLADEAVYWERKSKKLAQEEAWIRRGVKARTTRNEGRVAALLKLREEFAARRREVGTATMKLDTAAAGGVKVLKIEKLGFGWGAEDGGRTLDGRRETLAAEGRETLDGRQVSSLPSNVLSGLSSQVSRPSSPWLFRSFSADVLRGERIGILGRNGAGKTTLLKLLTGKLKPTEGSVTLGTGVEMAFLDQLRGELNPALTVGENIASDRDEVIVGGVKKHVYSYLADFLFAPERVRTPVKALSGGERARLMLAKLFLKPANLLVMDEPTNDLDIETLELLEEQLLNYTGTLLLVSHDREFLDNVVTSTFVLEGDGEVRQYPGGYADYERQRAARAEAKEVKVRGEGKEVKVRGEGEQRNLSTCASGLQKDSNHHCSPSPSTFTSNPSTFTSSQRKLSYKEQRELDALPAKIDALEKEIAAIEADLVAGKIYTSERLAPAQEELEAAVERWAELEERSLKLKG